MINDRADRCKPIDINHILIIFEITSHVPRAAPDLEFLFFLLWWNVRGRWNFNILRPQLNSFGLLTLFFNSFQLWIKLAKNALS